MDRPTPAGAQRVYVVELEPGDVIFATHEIVHSVERVTDHRTIVTMTNGRQSGYNSGHSTALIEKKEAE
jgi:hypothetical protein